jgi:hypothetical protein
MPKYHWLPFGLMHLRIERLVGILGRRRDSDDGRIDNRAGGHLHSLGCQVPLHLIEQPPAEIVRLQQVAEAAHRKDLLLSHFEVRYGT